jgi:hypothetical protein
LSVIIVAKEDQNGGAAVNSVSKKRPVEDSVALAGPSAPKVKKETKAPKTEAAPKKTVAVPRGARKVW